MSETGFQLFSTAFSPGAELLYAAFLAAFLRPFVKEPCRRRLLLLLAAYPAICLLCTRLPAFPGISSLALTALLAAAAKSLGLERAPALLLALFFWNARISSGLVVESLSFLAERRYPSPMEPPEAVFLRAAVLMLLFLLCHALLLAGMLFALQRQMRKRRMTLLWRELCYLSFVPAAGILFGQVISRLLVECKDGVLLQLYERHPDFLAVVPVLALLFYAGAWLTVVLQQGMAALREEQAAWFVERRQMQAIQTRIQEAEQFYARIRRLQHEMRGHLTALKGLARSGEYAGLEDYITRMDGSLGDFALTLQTGNPVTDVLVNDTRQRSLSLGIRFQAEFHYPESGAYDAFDVGIVLQNLLQNALEACEKVPEDQRFLQLAGMQRGRFFLIEVKNSFAGTIAFGPDGFPATTKQEDPSMHGIGLAAVLREAEKYLGRLELKTEGQEFSATVLLQERSR